MASEPLSVAVRPGTLHGEGEAGRVIYLLHKYPQLSQTFVRDEIEALRAAGTDVDVVTIEPGTVEGSGVHLASFEQLPRPSVGTAFRDHVWFCVHKPAAWIRYLTTIMREPTQRRLGLLRVPTAARATLARGAPDWCHTHFAWSTASVVAGYGALIGARLSITLHAKDIYTPGGRVVRRRIRPFDRVITVCHFNVGYLTAIGAGPSGRIEVVPCGVAGAETTPTDGADMVSVARLVPKKGVDTLIEAVRRVPEGRLDIVGDGPERSRLEALAIAAGLADRVRFLGPRPHAETLRRIGGARLFCLAARPADDGDMDAMPVVLREAMARGVPVVATTVAGIPESIDREVGWLVPPDDPEALAAAIKEALGDERCRSARGAAARHRARTLWTFERQAATLTLGWARRQRS